MIEMLKELTKGEYWSNKQNFKEEFSNRFYNGMEILKQVDMDECNQFYDKGSNAELLIYNNNNKIIYSCCYEEYYNKKIVTHIYNKNGLVYSHELDYDKMDNEFKNKK